ncbi:MAG: DHH family phosphoesterase [Clostridia bacterium]|nr:DHH family phosphoesterase [Clostridia bacterium]
MCLIVYALAVARLAVRPLVFGACMVVLYAGLCALAYYFLERKRKTGKMDETLAPVMGRIMFDAVVKMNAPVFICDKNERIVWYNTATEALYSEKNKLYGESVSELFGVTLADIRGDRSEKGARITCDGRSFLARYNHIKTDDNDFALVMTTETTELDILSDKMAGDELVVSYIIIDNLGEMMQYDSEQYRPAAAKIDEILRDWADEYGGILKEYEKDKYLFITEARVLDEMILAKFDILDRVRAVRVGDTNLPLTISMGVSNIHGSYEAKEKAAHAALDMALQRGGDQAAVKGDSSMDFYGGITKSVQKRTNVRARVVSNELMAAMKSASNVLIMGHQYADFDAFGACTGLARIAMYCGARVNIVINTADRNLIGCRTILEPEEEFLGIFVSGTAALDLMETGTLVIVADVNDLSRSEAPELACRTEKLAIIDHHRKNAEFKREPDVEYIEPSASATCEIVAEMLEQVLQKDDFTPAEATLMLAGITLDTAQFTKNTGTRTFSAAMYLRDRGADPALVQSLFLESYEDYMREAKFRQNVEIYRGCCAITMVDDPDSADHIIAAKAANNLLKVSGIRASFALIRIGDTLRISARSDGTINVQLIMAALGGGGHYESAAAQCTGRTSEEILAELKKAIDQYVG